MSSELWRIWKLMWRLGGPFAVFVYKLDGSLAERIDRER